MKTPEDEAFDDLARNQGAWGGGFPAKRAMAMDKMREPDEALTLEALKYAASKGYGRIVREMKIAPFTIKETLAQPVQDSANYLRAVLSACGPDAGMSLDQKGWAKLHAAIKAVLTQPAQERNFCSRCGKRTNDIHTCTPPQEAA